MLQDEEIRNKAKGKRMDNGKTGKNKWEKQNWKNYGKTEVQDITRDATIDKQTARWSKSIKSEVKKKKYLWKKYLKKGKDKKAYVM